jgi:hypothetical protein
MTGTDHEHQATRHVQGRDERAGVGGICGGTVLPARAVEGTDELAGGLGRQQTLRGSCG